MEEQKRQDDSMVMDMKAEKDSSSNKRNIDSIVLEVNEPSKKHKVDDSGVVEACAMTSSSASKDPKEAITALSEEIQQLSEDISYYYELLAKFDNGTQAGYAQSEIQKLIEDTKEERMRKQMEYDTLLVEALDKLMIDR